MRALGYIRVSTEEQARGGVSMDAQRASIEQYATAQGLTLNVFEDAGISGGRMSNRPGLAAAVKAARRGDMLVVYSLSRLARSTRETLNLEDELSRRGVSLYSLTESIETRTPAGRVQFRILAAFAELERDMIAERTRAALQYKKAQGQRVGSIPYGYRLSEDGVHLTPDPAEQVVIEAIREYHAAGLSLRAISERLQAQGFSNRVGAQFNPKTLSNILKAA